MKKFSCLKGMKDYTSDEIRKWNYLLYKIKKIIISYGYEEIIFPIIENIELFKKSIGINTDINKQMYIFKDINNKYIALRPEGTTICMRYLLNKGLFRGQKNKFFYFGPMFRHENTQLGRHREFYQLGIESIGYNTIGADLELIIIIKKIFDYFKIYNYLNLEINYIGSKKIIDLYKLDLMFFFKKNISFFKENNINIKNKNPFIILKNNIKLIKDNLKKEFPKIINYLNKNDLNNFNELKLLLDFNNIKYIYNPLLFRGINYYNNFVFEWITNKFNYNFSICSGGRYDFLSKNISKKFIIPSCGLAIGWNRFILFLNKINPINKVRNIDIYITLTNINFLKFTINLSENIRKINKNINIFSDYSVSNIKNKKKIILKNNINILLIVFKKINNKEILIYKNILNKEESFENIDSIMLKINNFFIKK